jgi:hypothetical protein
MNLTTVASSIVSRFEAFAPFGKFERITAGVCMAIPFFLMIVDPSGGTRNLWLLTIPFIIVVIPQLISVKTNDGKNRKNDGLIITLVGAVVLFILYYVFTQVFEIQSKDSISAYVTMNGAHVFGMLLSIAAMLFMASGVVYWNKKPVFREGTWRSILNLILGFLLLGVVVFPCTTMPTLHGIVALFFFLGCAAGTLIRDAKEGKKLQHKIVDYTPVLVMGFAMFSHFAVAGEWFGCSFCRWPFNLFNLFGAESIALWITGLDFILVSLKRELADDGGAKNTNPPPETLQQLLDGGAKLKH